MPAKSKAQLRKLFVLERQGKLPPGKAKEFAHETPSVRDLPEHVGHRRKPVRKSVPHYQMQSGYHGLKAAAHRLRSRMGGQLAKANAQAAMLHMRAAELYANQDMARAPGMAKQALVATQAAGGLPEARAVFKSFQAAHGFIPKAEKNLAAKSMRLMGFDL